MDTHTVRDFYTIYPIFVKRDEFSDSLHTEISSQKGIIRRLRRV